jgi:hypothetical protein
MDSPILKVLDGLYERCMEKKKAHVAACHALNVEYWDRVSEMDMISFDFPQLRSTFARRTRNYHFCSKNGISVLEILKNIRRKQHRTLTTI